MRRQRPKIKKIIDGYKDVLTGLGIRVQRVILFGSHAGGNQRTDSDIDLVIVSDDFRRMNLRRRLEVLGVAAARMMQPIEAQGYTTTELKKASPTNFLGEVMATGVLV